MNLPNSYSAFDRTMTLILNLITWTPLTVSSFSGNAAIEKLTEVDIVALASRNFNLLPKAAFKVK